MTPQQLRQIMRDILKKVDAKPKIGLPMPICAFALRNGQILTGSWDIMNTTAQTVIMSLHDKDAPPIYIDVTSIAAIAVSNAMPIGEWPQGR